MLLTFAANKILGYDDKKSSENLCKKYTSILEGLMAFPCNIRGTKYHKAKKVTHIN